jgi:membrane-bound metal-dependent hydrolase YbcI (DUF457 family)
MDPISQGAVGAAFSQTAASRESLRAYAIFGCLAGMAPDLDVFIQSSTDPLLFLEYHRHFTHALVFIPVGALIVTSVLFRLFRHPLSWQQAYLAAFIGYATHGLLDACTSYGTLLLWPFSDVRVAWNNVSVVDPLLTLPLLGLIISSAISRKRRYAVAAVAWLLTYLGLGMVQHERASDAARQMALAKGHQCGRPFTNMTAPFMLTPCASPATPRSVLETLQRSTWPPDIFPNLLATASRRRTSNAFAGFPRITWRRGEDQAISLMCAMRLYPTK